MFTTEVQALKDLVVKSLFSRDFAINKLTSFENRGRDVFNYLYKKHLIKRVNSDLYQFN